MRSRWFLAGIAAFLTIYGIPWALYAAFSHVASGIPDVPARSGASTWKLKQSWAAHQGYGPYLSVSKAPMRVERRDPWGYLRHVFCGYGAMDSGTIHSCVYRYAGTMPIYSVVTHHMTAHGEGTSGLWGTLRVAALSIWLSRHWSAEDLAEYLLIVEPNPIAH